MFYPPSSRHSFDIMFVILCVIAGANSHSISNHSKMLPTSKLPINRYRTSFNDLILHYDQIMSHPTADMISDSPDVATKVSIPSTTPSDSYNICAILSNVLSGQQTKFCQRHQNLLEIVLPRMIELLKSECRRITKDLRWNCSSIEPYLDRSNSMSLTKEAALIRSILNASMMYLTIKICNGHSHHLCGCEVDHTYHRTPHIAASDLSSIDLNSINQPGELIRTEFSAGNMTLGHHDLLKLSEGSPLRLSKSILRRQGCTASVTFAYAFTKVFLDSDDTKSLDKAIKILNEDYNDNKIFRRGSFDKRLVDADYKDLAFIKWTKSAINLHNNHVGRQVIREATQRKCRCHGLSGVCQFQTCWDQMLELSVIIDRLRAIFTSRSQRVEVKNLGSPERPDLYLTKSSSERSQLLKDSTIRNTVDEMNMQFINPRQYSKSAISLVTKLSSNELVYFYDSPDYCEVQSNLNHPGTKGRRCVLATNHSKPISHPDETDHSHFSNSIELTSDISVEDGETDTIGYGTCEELCCNRGYSSELVFVMVTCNCRFKFCCRVKCEHCLRQQVQHFCL